ncbi:MAG: hypothetical protein ACM3MK_02740 [Chitinophagales bacterium]
MEAAFEASYEQTFMSQPLYCNKFQVSAEEKDFYMNQVPAWFKNWQTELDKIYAKAVAKAA